MARIIAMSNHKGGVGKTTSVVNVGAGMARLGKRTLVVDLDPQENLTQSLGVADDNNNIYGGLRGEYIPKPIHITENFDMIPSTLDLSGAEVELSAEAGREYLLREILEHYDAGYDFIIIDCPPSLGLLTINALSAADEVIIPIQSHYLAIKGLTKITEVIRKIQKRVNQKLEVGGVIVTQYDKRKVLNRDVAESIYDFFQERVFKTKIRDNIALAEAPSAGKDIFTYNPKSYGAIDYMKLSKEILERE